MSASEFKDKGNKHLQAGEFDEAIAAYSEAISINPDDHVFYSNRSAAYLSKGNSLAALNDAENVIRVNPTWPKGYSRKGIKRYHSPVETMRFYQYPNLNS